MSTMAIGSSRTNRKVAPLTYFLGFIFALFIGILIFCYAVTKRTNPVFLDEHGKPVPQSSEHAQH